MNRSIRLACIACLIGSLTQLAAADEGLTRVALNVDSKAEPAQVAGSEPLDRYVGRYDAGNGLVFFVIAEDAHLAIEVEDAGRPPQLQLRSTGTNEFVAVAGAPLRAVFQLDAEGNVRGATFYLSYGNEGIAAVRTPFPNGIVTIHDVHERAEAVASTRS